MGWDVVEMEVMPDIVMGGPGNEMRKMVAIPTRPAGHETAMRV
jgi:hypothetical protein